MKISYDKSVDALNVSIRAGKVARTSEVAPGIMLDFDRTGKALNLEILDASHKVGRANIGTVRIGTQSVALAA